MFWWEGEIRNLYVIHQSKNFSPGHNNYAYATDQYPQYSALFKSICHVYNVPTWVSNDQISFNPQDRNADPRHLCNQCELYRLGIIGQIIAENPNNLVYCIIAEAGVLLAQALLMNSAPNSDQPPYQVDKNPQCNVINYLAQDNNLYDLCRNAPTSYRLIKKPNQQKPPQTNESTQLIQHTK